MKGTIFLVNTGGELAPMRESRYVNEAELQKLLARYWDLLPGDQIDPEEPRPWMFVGREVGIPGGKDESNWLSLNHLFLDHEAVPTFVECKDATDTRARREVVAQMLDYAANASADWSVDRIRQLATRSDDQAPTLDEQVTNLIAPGSIVTVDDYWRTVEDNLRRGKIRLIFVLDEASRELRRLVEFLNEQMTDTEVLLLEIKQFKGENDLHALVPRLVGATERSRRVKRGTPFLALPFPSTGLTASRASTC